MDCSIFHPDSALRRKWPLPSVARQAIGVPRRHEAAPTSEARRCG